jgi:hypothetical protein
MGWRRIQRPRESLVLYKSFNTLWGEVRRRDPELCSQSLVASFIMMMSERRAGTMIKIKICRNYLIGNMAERCKKGFICHAQSVKC